jgi:hypothetical protein
MSKNINKLLGKGEKYHRFTYFDTNDRNCLSPRLIGCAVARHLVNLLSPEPQCSNRKDGKCSKSGEISSSGSPDENYRVVYTGTPNKPTLVCGDKAAIKGQLEQKCERWKGAFQSQCQRAVSKLSSELARSCKSSPKKSAKPSEIAAPVRPTTKGGAAITPADLESAILRSGVCRHPLPNSTLPAIAAAKGGTQPRSIHTSIWDLVEEDDVDTCPLCDGGGESHGSGRVPPRIHFIFGMAPDFGGKPFGLVHYLRFAPVKWVPVFPHIMEHPMFSHTMCTLI